MHANAVIIPQQGTSGENRKGLNLRNIANSAISTPLIKRQDRRLGQSNLARLRRPVALMAERWSPKPGAVSSNLTGPAIFLPYESCF